MNYRVGLPGWKWVARARFPVSLRVNVSRDDEAGVFVASSPDLAGLVAEAATLDELVKAVNAGVDDLMADYLHVETPERPITNLLIDRACCA